MSTSKYINKICIVAVIIIMAIAAVFIYFGYLQPGSTEKSMEYEDTLFDNSYVHTINIEMEDWDGFLETCENEEYTACDLEIDGEKCQSVAIRAKGNTSLSSVKSMGSQRYSLKIEFDHYVNGKNYDGLDKLCLNNLIQDNTMMKDYIAYQMMNDFGVDSPLCSFVYVTVNGEDWGLFLAVEGVEDSFLTRNYGDSTGELYKPDSMGMGGGRGNGKDFDMDKFDFDSEASDKEGFEKPDMGDFNPEDMPEGGNFNPENMPQGGNFNPEDMPQGDVNPENMPQGGDVNSNNSSKSDEEVSEDNTESKRSKPGGGPGGMGSDDVKLKYIDDDPDSYSNIFNNSKNDVKAKSEKRLIASLKNLSTYSDLENTVDIDEVMRYFVVHNFVCNGDSYTGSMVHNYYLREKDGVLSMIPWDYNLAFGTFQGGSASSSVNASIDSPVSNGDVDDRPMLGWIFSDQSYTDTYHELFAEFVARWFSNGELEQLIADTAEMVRPYVEKDPTKFCTAEEFEAGIAAMQQFVSLRGEAVSRQLAGDTTAVETGDLNLSDMGSMGGGFGGSRDKGDAEVDTEQDNQSASEASESKGEKTDTSGASQQPGDKSGTQQPPGGGQKPPEGMQQPPSGGQKPPEGGQKPADGGQSS